jgi:cellulose synthase operon protein C
MSEQKSRRRRRQVNGPFLFGFIFFSVIAFFTISFIHGRQAFRLEKAYLNLANAEEKNEDLPKAVAALGRYLSLHPDDVENQNRFANWLALTAKSLPDRINALKSLERAVARSPEQSDLRRKLVRLAIAPGMGKFVDPKPHLDLLSQAFPNDAEVLELLGQRLASEGNFSEAAMKFKEARDIDVKRIDSYIREAIIKHERLYRIKEADDTIDAMLSANPDKIEAYIAAARYFSMGTPNRKKLRPLIAKAKELAPEKEEVILLVADDQRSEGDLPGSEKSLADALKSFPNSFAIIQSLATVQSQQQKFDEARKTLQDGIKLLPKQSELLWSLADLEITARRFEEAKPLMDKIRVSGLQPILIHFLEGRLAQGLEDELTAAQAFESVVRDLPERPALSKPVCLALSECYESLGDLDRRITTLVRGADEMPLDLDIGIRLGAAFAAKNDLEQAINTYQRFVGRAPGLMIPITELVLRQTIAKPVAQRKWGDVETLIDQLDQLQPKPLQAWIYRADLASIQERLGDAEKLYLQAKEKFPKEVDPIIGLALLKHRNKQPEVARELLANARKELGDRIDLRLTEARLLFSEGKPPTPEQLKPILADQTSLTKSDRRRLSSAILSLYQQAGDQAGAEFMAARMLDLTPSDLSIHLIRFDQALSKNDRSELDKALTAIVRIDGAQGVYSKLARAIYNMRLESQSALKLREAEDCLIDVERIRPNWNRAYLAQGQLAELLKNPVRAIDRYRKAIELGATDPAIVERTVRLLYDQRQFAEIDRLIKKIPISDSKDVDLQRIAAETSLQMKDYSKARLLAEKSMDADSKDPREQLWLAQMLIASGDLRAAEAPFRKAVKLGPKLMETWVSWMQYLAREKRIPELRIAFEDGKKQLPNDLVGQFQAIGHELLGEIELARAAFQNAQKQSTDNIAVLRNAAEFHLRQNDAPSAEPLLQRIIELTNSSQTDIEWAKRSLAVVLAIKPDFGSSQRALNLLGVTEARLPDQLREMSPEAIRSRAIVLSLQKTRPPREDALRLFRELEAQKLMTVEDRFLQAQVFVSLDQWRQAKPKLEQILKDQPDNSLYLSYSIRQFQRQKELGEAKTYLDRLTKLQPKAPVTGELQVRQLAAEGKADDAIELGKKLYIEQMKRPEVAALLLEDVKLDDAAETIYRELIREANRPEAGLLLANFLIRKGRSNEAIEVLRRARGKLASSQVAVSSLTAVFATDSPDPKSIADIRAWMEERIATEKDPTEMRIHLASLESLQGNHEASIRGYQKILEQLPDNPLTLNNLAFLTAATNPKSGGDQALAMIKLALSKTGPIPNLLDTEGTILLLTGQFSQAVKVLESVVTEAPNPVSYFHLAQAQMLQQDADSARISLKKAISLGLRPAELHPLERPALTKLKSELKIQ